MSKWTFAFLFMFLSFGKSVLGSPGANTEIRLIYLTADKSAELLNGHLLFVNSKGSQLDLPRSSRIELGKIRSPNVVQNRGLLP